jgi:tRNA G18 (ribose-2'-O)-methylase SpoU
MNEYEPQNLILEGRKVVLELLNHEKHIDRLLIRKDGDKPIEGTLRLIAAKAKDLVLSCVKWSV